MYKKLGEKLHALGLIFILVQPAYRPIPDTDISMFTSQDFLNLKDSVDYFSIMTYDFSEGIGPNSPLPWVLQSMYFLVPPELRSDPKITKKLLMGIPFYGYHYPKNRQPEPIIGNAYLDILKNERPPFEWDEVSHEHFFRFGKDEGSIVYYPTLKFVQERIQLAHELGVGIGIWEIGQGLDYFYDLL